MSLSGGQSVRPRACKCVAVAWSTALAAGTFPVVKDRGAWVGVIP